MGKTLALKAAFLATFLCATRKGGNRSGTYNVHAFITTSHVVPHDHHRQRSPGIILTSSSSCWALCALQNNENDTTIKGKLQREGSLSSSDSDANCSCDEGDISGRPRESSSPMLMYQPNGARILRSSVVMDVNGDYIPLDRPMGRNKSIVIFLRHMG
jgi:hypothetical protein